MLLFLGADAVFVLCLLFSYFYLRGLNVQGMWIPAGTHTAPVWAVWTIAAVIVASALAYRWGERGIRAGDRARLVAGTSLALALLLVDAVLQAWQLSALPFRASDGAYAGSFVVLAGYHLFHLVVTGLLGLGLWNRARAGRYDAARFGQVRLMGYVWSWVAAVAVLTAITTLFVASPKVS